MATLADLLRYKRKVDIKDQHDNTLMTVWVRLLGDADLQESYKKSRIASAKRRMALRDRNADEFFDEVSAFADATKEECIATIVASRSSGFMAQAISANDRDELPKMQDIALDPDAPSLEEQEKLDYEKLKREMDYQQKLQDFVETRRIEETSKLEEMSLEELRPLAQEEAINILSLNEFATTLADEKTWRSVYEDELCTRKAFHSVAELKDVHTYIKDQLIAAYQELELSPDEIKN